MATDKFPQQNVNMPMDPRRVEAARARLAPPTTFMPQEPAPLNGKGSRREVRKGEWVDDRVIVQGGPSSPSADSPPDIKPSERALPTFTAGKVYQVTLGKPCVFSGRMLSPAKSYQMTGETCLDPDVQPCIADAVELGDTPQDPDIAPSVATSQGKTEQQGKAEQAKKKA